MPNKKTTASPRRTGAASALLSSSDARSRSSEEGGDGGASPAAQAYKPSPSTEATEVPGVPLVAANDDEEEEEEVVSGQSPTVHKSPAFSKSPPARKRSVSPFRVKTSELDPKAYTEVIKQLKNLYMNRIKPLEQRYRFDRFGYQPLTEAELEAKAQVLFCGQYSTGKTTMIKYILGRDYPGAHVGPEPTTDRFTAVVHGEEEKILQGNSVTVVPELAFAGTEQFGSTFLEKFQASVCRSDVLKHMTFIDTPGVLAGKKQRTNRLYDFPGVMRWFAERSDLILLLFDAYKLDISDEFEEIIQHLKEHDAKVRLVLNKADALERSALTRVYGALMWSVGKVLRSPEVARVYVGSYWDEPRKAEDSMFVEDEEALMQELANLPRMCPIRKINDLVRRVRMLKVYITLLATLRSRMPWFKFLRLEAQKALLAALPSILEEVRVKYDLSPGDIPPVEYIRERLQRFPDFCEFPRLSFSSIRTLDEVKDKEIPRLMKRLDGVTDALSDVAVFAGKGGSAGGGSKTPRGGHQQQQAFSVGDWEVPMWLVVLLVAVVVVGAAVAVWYLVLVPPGIANKIVSAVDQEL